MAERIVEIISKDKRYRKEPYPSRPAYDTRLKTYLTGQHIVPGDKDRADYLTNEEMIDVQKISAAKLKKFPASSVISPNDVTMISHRRKLNLTPIEGKDANSKYPGDFIYPADKALYEYLLEREFVARSEDEYNNNVHYFYILDKETVAVARLSKREKRYQAEKFIREKVKITKYRSMALLLNHKITDFNILYENVTDAMLQDSLLEAAEKYPDIVLACDPEKNPQIEKELFVLTLIDKQLISIKSGAYYDGGKFIGSTVPAVIETLEKDEALMAKLAALLNA